MSRPAARQAERARNREGTRRRVGLREPPGAAFYLFCAFLISYFTHLTARVPLLGALHFDLLLAVFTGLAIALAPSRSHVQRRGKLDPAARNLWILLGYIVVTVPFVEWPGSVLHNLEGYAKSVCFFFFVIATVDSVSKLKTLLIVYTGTQLWRVFEPLFMHVKSGYWGSYTSLGNWEYMDRLAGSPYDIINPNGLAFVVIMTLPLVHLILRPNSPTRRMLFAVVAALMCYALVLSASRSGFLGLIFLGVLLIWRTKHRVAFLAGGLLVFVVALSLMSDLQRERYVSIFSHSAKGGQTAEARITGVMGDFRVSLRRPFFGHGLGTSREANANFRGEDLPSHNLYTEVAEELGYIGLVLLLALIWSFLRACWEAQRLVSAAASDNEQLQFLHDVATALVVVVAVDLFFSFASFGFSEPYWYFFGGLSVATARLAVRLSPESAQKLQVTGRRGRLRSQQGKRRALGVGPVRGLRRIPARLK
ncbi:MAG: O-antigen ligase family protein [Proteobacteria bacterium]|nr:O-antigen ligase family protein [Pseudomonadota bacterium]